MSLPLHAQMKTDAYIILKSDMRVRCYSVRLVSLELISPLAYKATAYDGSSAIIPASQVYGRDDEINKSDGYWISAWILERKSLQYSRKKSAYFDKDTRRMLPNVIIEKHHPNHVQPVKDNTIPDLRAE